MTTRPLLTEARPLATPFRVVEGHRFRLEDDNPPDTPGHRSADKRPASDALSQGAATLADTRCARMRE